MKNKDKELVEIKIKFNNGEEKILKKAMVVDFEECKQDKDLVNTTYHLLGISRNDLRMVIMSMLELGMKLGMFDKEGDNE